MDRKSAVLVASLDLQAAFDTNNHRLLLKVFHNRIGITGTVLTWLENHLYQRSEKVLIGSSVSNSKYLNDGVPQGSRLGPVLFNMFQTTFCDLVDENEIMYIYVSNVNLTIELIMTNGKDYLPFSAIGLPQQG